MDGSLCPTGCIYCKILHLWDFYASGAQDTEVTKSLTFVLTFCVRHCVCVHWDDKEGQKNE